MNGQGVFKMLVAAFCIGCGQLSLCIIVRQFQYIAIQYTALIDISYET